MSYHNGLNYLVIYLRHRKFVWLDPKSMDETEFNAELAKGKTWYEMQAEQTTYGILHFYDEDLVVIATEVNEDGSPREVVIIPRSLILYPKRLMR